VHDESAVIGDARENRMSIHADHIRMAKFSTRSDDGYKKILYAIEMVLEWEPMDKPTPAEEGM
jgi:protein SERAC1